MRINNYFDGPFDQLPDNFIEGETLRNAIVKVQPDLKGKIDRFGGVPGGEVRYSISPYLVYRRLQEFNHANRCAVRHRSAEAAYYRCFIFDNEQQDLRAPPPDEDAPVKRRKRVAPKN